MWIHAIAYIILHVNTFLTLSIWCNTTLVVQGTSIFHICLIATYITYNAILSSNIESLKYNPMNHWYMFTHPVWYHFIWNITSTHAIQQKMLVNPSLSIGRGSNRGWGGWCEWSGFFCCKNSRRDIGLKLGAESLLMVYTSPLFSKFPSDIINLLLDH